MIRQLVRRLFQRPLPAPRPDDAIREANERLRNAEAHLAAQRREGQAAVNVFYDRIAPVDRGEP